MDAVTLALMKSMAGGGSSLPAVTSSDNGKVLAVQNGAWAAASNLFVIQKSGSIADKTVDEITAAISSGKTVVYKSGVNVSAYESENDAQWRFVKIYSISSTYYCIITTINKTNRSINEATAQCLPPASSSDNGSEIIVKSGLWTKQKKKFVVTLTPTELDYSGTMDKTVAEINAAYEAGMEIWFKVVASGYDILIPMSNCSVSSSYTYPSFDCRMVDINTNVEVCVRTGVADDGTKQTYSTKIYSLTPAS